MNKPSMESLLSPHTGDNLDLLVSLTVDAEFEAPALVKKLRSARPGVDVLR